MIYNRYVKRMLDIILSLAAIICLSPVFLIVAAVVCITMGFPVLFSQERMGKDEKVFRLYKFRSMTNAKDKNGKLLPEQKRLTKAGKLLRSLSVDELPELFSILAGDMSFVGPRPLPVYYKPYFLPKERVRHKVRGGLIPSDDLSGKVMTSWEEQFACDVYYANHVSFLLDVKIILRTLMILVDRVRTDYGKCERPHLSEYRAEMRNGKNDFYGEDR